MGLMTQIRNVDVRASPVWSCDYILGTQQTAYVDSHLQCPIVMLYIVFATNWHLLLISSQNHPIDSYEFT